MNIGIDITPAAYGTGVSDYTVNLVRCLAKIDPSNTYTLFGSTMRRNPTLSSLFPRAKLFPFPPRALHLLWNKMHIYNIDNLIGHTDVFHSSDWLQPPTSAVKVTTVHDLSPFLYPREMRSGGLRDIKSVHTARMHWVVKECNKIICVSRSTARELYKLFPIPANRIDVIYEALPDRFCYQPTPAENISIKQKYGLDDYILAVGTTQPRKNIPRLVKAFLDWQEKLKLPQKLVIVGGQGWGMTGIPASDKIIFTGYHSDKDLCCLFSQATVFAYPSLHEGFGLPILISFYHRVPVVTSNISSMPEVAGNAAILINPESEKEIAQGIRQAMNQHKHLVTEGNKQLSRFSWDATARETLTLYNSLC